MVASISTASQGIVYVTERHQPGGEWYVRAGQSIRVTAAVIAFMVMSSDVGSHLQERQSRAMLFHYRSQSIRPDRGVGLHLNSFFRIELARFQQNMVG